MSRLLAVVVGLLLLTDGLAEVQYSHGRLSVAFDKVPLDRALTEVGVVTGVAFVVQPGVDGELDVRFRDQPLADAIRHLLADYNFLLLHQTTAEGQRQPERVLVMARSAAPATDVSAIVANPAREPAQLILRRQPNGPYMTAGRINGKAVDLLVDTGATTVTLSSTLAQRLRLQRGAARIIDTAGGRTTGYETVLQRLELGSLRLDNVRAIILPDMPVSDRVLLGMNVLQELEMIQRDGSLILRQLRD